MLYVNFSVLCLNFAQKWSLSYFQPISAAIFVTIATVKVKLIPDFYTSYCEEIGENNFHFLASKEDQNSPLMYVALL